MNELLTNRDVAALLHVHVNTVVRLGDRGELAFHVISRRGDRRYSTKDVQAFIDRSRIPGYR